jgi:molybdopterin synthase catalytic subunit
MSRVRIEIVEGPLSREMLAEPSLDEDALQGVGSRIRFEGIVRGAEDGRSLEAIDYEVYEPMASRMLEAIAHEEASREGVRSMVVIHSRGRVAVGEASFLCEVRSAHRAEGLATLGSFIDRMKRDVPIWKRLVFLEHR